MKRDDRLADSDGANIEQRKENGADELLFEWLRKPAPGAKSEALHPQMPEHNEEHDEEEAMPTQTKLSPHVDHAEGWSELEELKARLRRIEQLAAEGQELLSALLPRLEEYSSLVAEVDSVVRRWKR